MMELGEKLLRARQEAGLSQRQLCGDVITRNMLSQIEHGTARPSMDTLRYLAGRLGKSMSYFLEEDVVTSSNLMRMQQARAAWAAGEAERTREILNGFQLPDDSFYWEWRYLMVASSMAAAEQAFSAGKPLYARKLLEEMETADFPELERKKLLLLGRLPGADLQSICGRLPSLDEELLLRAEAALAMGDTVRAAALLDAAENRQDPLRNLLLGKVCLAQKRYDDAAERLQTAENAYPGDCWPLLEICFRELGDFQKAYFYACKQK